MAYLLQSRQNVTPSCGTDCPGSTHELAGATLLIAACVVSAGCATLTGSPRLTRIDNPNQVEALARAQVWQPTTVESMDLRQGPHDPGAFTPMATVNCRHVEKASSGATPKFTCTVGDDELKVKYGRENGEIYAEVAASRLLWALGFGADRVYPVRVVCTGCPDSIKPDAYLPGGRAVFEYATIDREVEGFPVPGFEETGWAWPDLDRVNPAAGGAPKEHRDALTLLAVLLQHTDSKREQQRFICLDPPAGGQVDRRTCTRPFLMIADLGKTFGKANTLNRDAPGSVNLKNWRDERVWRDGRECVGNMPKSLTGTLENPVISEAGRRFLAGLLTRLSENQIRDMFQAARFPDRVGHDGEEPGSVQDWVDAFKGKIAEVVNRDCSQPRQAAATQ